MKMLFSLSISIRAWCGFFSVSLSNIILRITSWIWKEKHFNTKATRGHLEEPRVFFSKRPNASALLSAAVLLLLGEGSVWCPSAAAVTRVVPPVPTRVPGLPAMLLRPRVCRGRAALANPVPWPRFCRGTSPNGLPAGARERRTLCAGNNRVYFW